MPHNLCILSVRSMHAPCTCTLCVSSEWALSTLYAQSVQALCRTCARSSRAHSVHAPCRFRTYSVQDSYTLWAQYVHVPYMLHACSVHAPFTIQAQSCARSMHTLYAYSRACAKIILNGFLDQFLNIFLNGFPDRFTTVFQKNILRSYPFSHDCNLQQNNWWRKHKKWT